MGHWGTRPGRGPVPPCPAARSGPAARYRRAPRPPGARGADPPPTV